MEYGKYRIYVEKLHLNEGKRVAYQATMEYGITELNLKFQIAMYSLKGLVNAFLGEMFRRRISVADPEFRINEDFKSTDSNKETTKFIALLNKEVEKRYKVPSSERNNKGGNQKNKPN